MFHDRQLPRYSDVHRYDDVRKLANVPGSPDLSRFSHLFRHGDLRR